MTLARRPRVDALGRAFAGSQRQIQTYVNKLPGALNAAIAEALGAAFPAGSKVRWVSPLAEERYDEYRDADFLHALGMSIPVDALSRFWPRRGPCWDALGCIEGANEDSNGCVLVEAKSHVPEFYSNDTRAGAHSLQLIRQSLDAAKTWYGVDQATIWTGFPDPDRCPYQYTNRLAHLYFFRAIMGIPAFLVSVHFVDDPRTPTGFDVWEAAIADIHKQLGLHRLPSCFASVFLPAMQ